MHSPFVTLGRTIETLHRDHPCEVILIAPKWPYSSWYARLVELLVNFPLVSPLRKDIFTQPNNHQRHQSLQAVRLHASRLSSDPSKQRDFLEPLPSKSREGETNPLELSTTVSRGPSLLWRGERSVDALMVSVQDLTEFLLNLFHDKRINLRTIKGYRSAIRSTISSSGSRTEFMDSYELRFSIRSFNIKRTPVELITGAKGAPDTALLADPCQ